MSHDADYKNEPTPSTPMVMPATFRALDTLAPSPRNSVTHSAREVDLLAAAIMEYGFTKPILADEQGIVAGHRRVLAMRALFAAGRAPMLVGGGVIPRDTIPTIDCSGWSEEQRRGYMIWDNASAEAPNWLDDVLKVEIGDLKDLGFDLKLTGLDDKTIGALLELPTSIAPEPMQAEPEEPIAPQSICCPSCGHEFSILQEAAKGKRKKKAA